MRLSFRATLFYGLVALSGVAGLGYQLLWTRMLSVSLGHEFIAVMAVVAAFFFGLALGSLVLNRWIRNSRKPHVGYAVAEAVIAIWAILLTQLIPVYNRWLPKLIGIEPTALEHWSIAFAASLLLLLPATLAMGATLPLLEQTLFKLWQQPKRVAGLYAQNTLGAVAGTLLATFLLIPQFGILNSQFFLATLNVICGAGMLMLFLGSKAIPDKEPEPFTTPGRRDNGLLALLFCSGFLGIGYEILVVRILSQIMENTVYSFAAVLAVFLLGTAMGAGAYQRFWALRKTQDHWQPGLQLLLATTSSCCLVGTFALWAADGIYPWLINEMPKGKLFSIAAELMIASLVLTLPTFCMGALFCHLSQKALPGSGLGLALGCNTLGSAIAPILFGLVILPTLGAKLAMAATAAGYWLLNLLILRTSYTASENRVVTWSAATVPCLMIGALLLIPGPLRFVTLSDGSEVVQYEDGVMAAVAVIEDSSGHHHLKVNNHFTMGGTASRFSDHRQTHIPMLLHGHPQTALYLGLGTGISFDAAQYYPGLNTVAVELIPEAIGVMDQFGVEPHRWNSKPQVIAADARRYVLSDPNHYDVIIAEIFHPSRDGAGSLYTVEHFQAVKQRLTEDGVFCQWLPLFQLDIPTLKTIMRSFLAVFPDAQLHLGHLSLQQPILCLAGFNNNKSFHPNWLLERIHNRQLQQQLIQARLNSDFALLGGFIGAGDALAKFAGEGPLNTDNNPVVIYSAPDFVYQQQQDPSIRLNTLLNTINTQPEQLMAKDDAKFGQRLERYWQGRNRFIETGMEFSQGQGISQIIATSGQELLSIVETSPDFEPAYRTLLMGAQAMSQVNPYEAYNLLSQLQAASPQQPQASIMKKRLFGGNL